MNQEKYESPNAHDGLLIECTYVADGTCSRFHFEANSSETSHLYAIESQLPKIIQL